ncbi:MAG TPA: hypothetical protein VGQ55_15345 [Pyrinomonadaceae bacterium]|jgi:hypothetical protein|nr:hypothetical protein [Pyrinomonadaceae bacterium]
MRGFRVLRHFAAITVVFAGFIVLNGCQPQPGTTTANTSSVNLSYNSSNSNSSYNAGNSSAESGTVVTAREPNQYQANVRLTLETLSEQQRGTLPAIGATVARSGEDRAMTFTLPNNEKVIYLDKAGMSYVILPNRKQYAELTKEALGFEVRRMLMPEQIVDQVKAIPGVKLVGDETANGRSVTKYAYSGAANTQTQAGTVATESYILVDKETGLPVHTETVSQSQSGGNVQGYSGLRIVTEMTDIKTTPDAEIFAIPSEFQKIDPEQVKAQATMIFNAVGAVIGQLMNQPQSMPSPVR